MMKNKIEDLTKKLTTARGVSGNETGAAQVAMDFLSPLGKTKLTNLGSVVCDITNPDTTKPKILLTAHLDQIGMIVTGVEKDGFLRVSAVGGLDKRLLPAQRVIVHTQTQDVYGVICSVPPHLQAGKEQVLKMENVFIDTGLTGEKADILSLGDMVTFDSDFKVLNDKYVTGPAMDNRLGCVCVMLALQTLQENNIACNASVLLTAQEETGCAGAAADVGSVDPDIAVVVDVSFANGFGAPKEKCGETGKGVMIGLSPVIDRTLFNQLINISKTEKIPYQTEIMGGRTGTDADTVATTNSGVRTTLLSIPLRHMHTPIEIANINDVKAVVDLIVKFVQEN